MSSIAVDERWLATGRPPAPGITRDGTYPTFAWLLARQLADGRYIAFPAPERRSNRGAVGREASRPKVPSHPLLRVVR